MLKFLFSVYPRSRSPARVPVQLKRCAMAVRMIVKSPASAYLGAPDAALVALLAKAFDWLSQLTSGRSVGIAAGATDEGMDSIYVSRLIHLAFMAPNIVQRLAKGDHPSDLTVKKLMRLLPLPENWAEQRSLLGFH